MAGLFACVLLRQVSFARAFWRGSLLPRCRRDSLMIVRVNEVRPYVDRTFELEAERDVAPRARRAIVIGVQASTRLMCPSSYGRLP